MTLLLVVPNFVLGVRCAIRVDHWWADAARHLVSRPAVERNRRWRKLSLLNVSAGVCLG